jgi:predicted adenylyl cyclase CyaB
MKNIEVEIRSFISKEQFDKLLEFLRKNAKFLKEDYQETHYLDSKEDLRIQRNNFFSKIWMKKGKIHDESREEIEIKFPKEDFEKLAKLFSSVGLNAKIKWFRDRKEFEWNGITVDLDYTKGYGYIIELEKMCSEEEKGQVIEFLKTKLKSLNIPLTPKEEFDKRFKHYEENWKTLTN